MAARLVHPEFAHLRHHWKRGEFLYALQLSNGVIKVGRTGKPQHRMTSHKKVVAERGLTIVRYEFFPTQCESAETERELVDRLNRIATRHFGFEWFVNVRWGEVLTLLRQISAREVVHVYARLLPGLDKWQTQRQDWSEAGVLAYIGTGRPAANQARPQAATA